MKETQNSQSPAVEYTRTFHEVHTSQDGLRWSRNNSCDDNPVGLASAHEAARKLLHSCHKVRVVHVVRRIKVLEEMQSGTALSQQQIQELLEKGSAIAKRIKGLTCNEGFAISMDTLAHGPTRVTISFSAESVLGKLPKGSSYGEAKWAWNNEAVLARQVALDDAVVALKEAGIKFIKRTHEIELRPS